jgi:hypothetical protein
MAKCQQPNPARRGVTSKSLTCEQTEISSRNRSAQGFCIPKARWWLGLLPIVFIMPLSGLSQTTIRLASCFHENMVLQRSTNTLLYGTGPAGKSVHVRYRLATGSYAGRRWLSKIEPAGTWQMELDLSSRDFDLKEPGSLWISEEGKARKSFTIKNVALGDVWLIAGWENQGLPAVPGEIDDSWDKSMVRFSGYRLSQNPGSLEAVVFQDWESWPDASHYGQFSTLQLRLAHLLAGGRFTDMAQAGFVGVVRVCPEDLESGLIPEAASVPIGATEHWTWVQQKVLEAQTNRWERLIQFKHQGIVTDEPTITNYAVPAVFPYAAFSKNALPAKLLSFKGAIWPRDPKSNVR